MVVAVYIAMWWIGVPSYSLYLKDTLTSIAKLTSEVCIGVSWKRSAVVFIPSTILDVASHRF